MRKHLKNMYGKFPKGMKYLLYFMYEKTYSILTTLKTREFCSDQGNTNIKNILFYHSSGLNFGGTEKSLQIIAKYINKDKYNILFMYSSKSRKFDGQIVEGRKEYLAKEKIKLIDFDYKDMDIKYPFIINGMNPNITKVIKDNKIDLIITAGTGYSEFPLNIIKKIPIIMVNIFGLPSTQKNIVKHLCISDEVKKMVQTIVPEKKTETIYIQSELPDIESRSIREELGLNGTDFIFGRIGRADDGIFDPIGIEAFKIVQEKYPDTYYLIMSPAPILVEKVKEENIKNVIFLPASADEKDIWSFHKTIDCLAHFRKDGESCGLNIAESMLCGKPIITHRSRHWNAHLEYLDSSFARVADIDNIEQYANFMIEMIETKKDGKIEEMNEIAKTKAEKLFWIDNNISKIEKIIEKIKC